MTLEEKCNILIKHGFVLEDVNNSMHPIYTYTLIQGRYRIKHSVSLTELMYINISIEDYANYVKMHLCEKLMKSRSLVIAGDTQQYHSWLYDHELDIKNYQLVTDISMFYGVSNVTCYLIGTYWTSDVYNHYNFYRILQNRNIQIIKWGEQQWR